MSMKSHMHSMISKKIHLSNKAYKHMINSRKRAKTFQEGDYVMVRLKPERLHARGADLFKVIRKIGPSMC